MILHQLSILETQLPPDTKDKNKHIEAEQHSEGIQDEQEHGSQ
jgi:hypothetical protein